MTELHPVYGSQPLCAKCREPDPSGELVPVPSASGKSRRHLCLGCCLHLTPTVLRRIPREHRWRLSALATGIAQSRRVIGMTPRIFRRREETTDHA